MPTPAFSLPVLLSGPLIAAAGHAETCEVIKAQIESKIRAGGVASFSLDVVDAAETVDTAKGRVVGTCGLGSKKIVYSVGPANPASASAASAAPRPAASPGQAGSKDSAILTECHDGSVSVGGDCKKK
jgi:hypothetical protein